MLINDSSLQNLLLKRALSILLGGKSILAWTAMLGEVCGLLATRNLQAHQIIFAFVWFYQGWKYTWIEQSNLFRGHSCMWSSHALLLCDLENYVSWWLCTDKFDKQTLLLIASQDSSFQLMRLFNKTKLSRLSIQYLIWTILGLIFMLSIFMRAKGNLGFTSFKTNFTLITGGPDMCGFNMFKCISFPFRT